MVVLDLGVEDGGRDFVVVVVKRIRSSGFLLLLVAAEVVLVDSKKEFGVPSGFMLIPPELIGIGRESRRIPLIRLRSSSSLGLRSDWDWDFPPPRTVSGEAVWSCCCFITSGEEEPLRVSDKFLLAEEVLDVLGVVVRLKSSSLKNSHSCQRQLAMLSLTLSTLTLT